MNINGYIDAAKEKLGFTSDYALSVELKIDRSTIAKYRSGSRSIDDYGAFKLAEILDIDAKEIIIASRVDSEKNEEKREFWENQQEQIKSKKSILCKIMKQVVI